MLILANLGARGVAWPKMVELAQARRLPPHAPVVGYGPHTDLELRQKALDAGCDAVVARSAVAKGIEQFNRREFYACHDSIELVWVDEPGDVRLMYQGLLQIAVAFYHVQNGNWRGMVKMMGRGKGKLLPFLPACQGVDLEGLLVDLEGCEVALGELGPQGMSAFEGFPAIRVAD